MSEPKNLYDVAREVTHAIGMTWYDPRTGQAYPPPGDEEPLEIAMRLAMKRQGAIAEHAQALECPKCGGNQNQIMNLSDQGAPFSWRCRLCSHHFHSGQQ
jgi:hypothetical protein